MEQNNTETPRCQQQAMRPRSCRAYAIIRFEAAFTQSCRNNIARDISLLANYRGHVCGIGEFVEPIEGYWPENKNVLLLEFNSVNDAQKWYECTPEVRQADWLHGVDILVVPINTAMSPAKPWIQIMDLRPRTYVDQIFYDEFLPAQKEGVEAYGGSAEVVSTKEMTQYRGRWDPRYIVLNCWPSREQFLAWHNSADYAPLNEMRQNSADSNIALFQLSPLRKKSDNMYTASTGCY